MALWGLAEAAVRGEKSKAHRGKKRQNKTTKLKTKVPWGKLLSQCSEVGFTSFPCFVRDISFAYHCLILLFFLLKMMDSESKRC